MGIGTALGFACSFAIYEPTLSSGVACGGSPELGIPWECEPFRRITLTKRFDFLPGSEEVVVGRLRH